MRINTNRN